MERVVINFNEMKFVNDFFKGKLQRWNDDRGFGFITAENGKADVFIHISAFNSTSRRPKVGDIILYQTQIDNRGKIQAVNAKIRGIAVNKSENSYKNRQGHHWSFKVISVIIFITIVAFIYKRLIVNTNDYEYHSPNNPVINFSNDTDNLVEDELNYQCDGRMHCSQMTSCKEAKFFLKNCPNTKMDGNRDGIPCEEQWCN